MEEILIIDDSEQICQLLAEYVLPELGYHPLVANTGRQGLQRLRNHIPDLILLDLQLPDISGLDLLRLIAQEGIDVPVILMTAHGSEGVAVEAFRLGARNYLIKPFSDTEARVAIDQALRERRLRKEKDQLTASLQQRIQQLTVLYRIGKSVTALLNQEQLLERIVEAGVYITQAEEGFLLLLDDQNEELYLRAAKNLGEQRAQSLRVPVDDSLAGQVVRTGKPARLDQSRAGTTIKVKTGFLVRSILQVPLAVGGRVIGVLAVDNHRGTRTFSEHDQYLLATLADYAAIAIENARLYEQVRMSEKRYRDLFANAYDLIFSLDRELRINSINKIGVQSLGYDEQALVGSALWAFCAPDSWKIAGRSLQSLLRGTVVQPFELELMNNEHEPIYLEVSAQPMHNGSQILGVHCIARNITERRRLEQQLVQSEKLSAIGQLVAGVAHELNNPLTSVSGYAQFLLRDTSLNEDSRLDIEQIHTQAERAARIVQNLLIFAREHKPERGRVDLAEVIRSTLALQNYQLRVENIQVELDLPPGLPTTVADPYQLQQVFLNLLTNARQAIVVRKNAGTIRISARVVPAPPHTAGSSAHESLIRIEFTDTGTGISATTIKKIFDPFFTTKPVGQGTGLGLSICFGIIREHHGQIWAESEIGVGTTVIVTLPLIETDVEEAPDDAAPPLELEEAVSYRVLVIDDEEPICRLLERLLNDLGHTVKTATDTTEAMNLIAANGFDLIISDVKMPGTDGFALLELIRAQHPNYADMVVFMTGDILSPETLETLEQSGTQVLSKPFSIEQLTHMMRTVAQRRAVNSHRG